MADQAHPMSAPHVISLNYHYAHENDTDVADFVVRPSLAFDPDKVAILSSQARIIFEKMGYKVAYKAGFDIVPSSRAAQSNQLSEHDKLSGYERIAKLTAKDIEP